jgi:L-tartrate/succinate antiporter
MKEKLLKALAPVLVGIIIAVIPAPAGLTANAWFFFAIFTAVVIALILEPIPAAAIGFIGVSLAAMLGLVAVKPGDSVRWALSGFVNTTVWLIFAAFMFALGYEKTGLGKRLALVLVKLLGKKTLGLGYAIAFTDLIIAPFTPSNTARSGGTIFPIIRNLPALYGSAPGETSRKIGSYIMWTALAVTCVTSSMFITALAPNLLALELVNKTSQIKIEWTEWMIGFLPVGIILILSVPYLVYKIYPPEIKSSPEVPTWASKELEKIGKITKKEITMAALAILALSLWIFGGSFIDATLVAMIVISLMLITSVVTWDDVLTNKAAWNVLVWFATLVAMADGLNKVGFVKWFAANASGLMTGFSPMIVMIMLVLVFFFVHYMFASLTAHTTALLPVILAAGAAIPGVNVKVFAMILCYSLGLMGILTPYATGPSPVYYGSGYIDRKDFWRLGFIFGLIYIAVLLLVGVPYIFMIQS